MEREFGMLNIIKKNMQDGLSVRVFPCLCKQINYQYKLFPNHYTRPKYHPTKPDQQLDPCSRSRPRNVPQIRPKCMIQLARDELGFIENFLFFQHIICIRISKREARP